MNWLKFRFKEIIVANRKKRKQTIHLFINNSILHKKINLKLFFYLLNFVCLSLRVYEWVDMTTLGCSLETDKVQILSYLTLWKMFIFTVFCELLFFYLTFLSCIFNPVRYDGLCLFFGFACNQKINNAILFEEFYFWLNFVIIFDVLTFFQKTYIKMYVVWLNSSSTKPKNLFSTFA